MPFLTQIEQLLGEETEPDAGFFVDSWTEGVAAASENFLRRQERKSRNHEMPWNLSWSFAPFFVGGAEAAAESPWPCREALAERSSMEDPGRHGGDEEADGQTADEAKVVRPLTLESARRVLGVEATSTRVQIRAAYRRMVNLYHPDLPAYRGAREQKLASDRMASINEAYRQLCAGSTFTAG
ncbi:MAG: J domain-containing protein [Acidobacteriaceae bacterium]